MPECACIVILNVVKDLGVWYRSFAMLRRVVEGSARKMTIWDAKNELI